MAMRLNMQRWSNVDDIVIAEDQIISSISPNLGVYATGQTLTP